MAGAITAPRTLAPSKPPTAINLHNECIRIVSECICRQNEQEIAQCKSECFNACMLCALRSHVPVSSTSSPDDGWPTHSFNAFHKPMPRISTSLHLGRSFGHTCSTAHRRTPLQLEGASADRADQGPSLTNPMLQTPHQPQQNHRICRIGIRQSWGIDRGVTRRRRSLVRWWELLG
jgi:hypothetical protein